MMQVCGVGNQEIQLGIGYRQEHILIDLQIIFLSSLSYAPSITPWFSLVLVRLPPAIPLVHNAFYKTPFHSKLRQPENNLLRKTKYTQRASKFSLII